MAESGERESVCNFIRKNTKNKQIRKRNTDEEDDGDDGDQPSQLSRRPRKTLAADDRKLVFSTGTSSASARETDDDAAAAAATVTKSFYFESSNEVQIEHDSRATATLETETEFSRDARAIRERVLKQARDDQKGKGKPGGGGEVYKGIHGYKDYKAGFRREQTVASEKAGGAHGPLRASAHIRVSARFDYQPDICKDYKETGYCGFGDSCKFMHDRGDYKSGWQMERDWDAAEKVRKRNLAMGKGDDSDDDANEGDDEDDDSLPFACFLCKGPFVDPVVTKCKHYFCEHCALKHHQKNKKCFVCNKPTMGIFDTAHEIKKKTAEVEGRPPKL